MLVNAVVLISGGQALRTPQLMPEQRVENPLKWEAERLHLLLSNLSFINSYSALSRFGYITLSKVSKMVHPYGWMLVAPLVISGIETCVMMAKCQVGSSSYINPHGDLSWVTFGTDMDIC